MQVLVQPDRPGVAVVDIRRGTGDRAGRRGRRSILIEERERSWISNAGRFRGRGNRSDRCTRTAARFIKFPMAEQEGVVLPDRAARGKSALVLHEVVDWSRPRVSVGACI